MTEDGGKINSVNTIHYSDTSSDSEEDEVSTTTIQEFNNDDNNYGLQKIAGIPTPIDASNLSTTVVKMKNNTNVEIKPITQVIVHQYFQNSNQSDNLPDDHAHVVSNVSQYHTQPATCTSEVNLNAETEPRATPNTSKKFYHAIISCVPRKLAIIIILTVSIAAVVVIAVCVTLTKKSDGTSDTYYPPNPSDLEETNYDLGDDIHIFTRGRWGGRGILDGYQNRTLVHPIKWVIIGHTASSQCMTVEECSSTLQTIQTMHVSKNNYVDIGYNFLVGGDGNIYQALGWDIRNYLRNNSIQIQFIGNYGFDNVLERQRMGLQLLLARGVELGKLDKDYLLIAHNQVANTESPGKNLVTEIKHWPHYYNGTLT